jgi:hypothetical protein
MSKVWKTHACRVAWSQLPPGEYTSQDIADAANALGLSEYCYAVDAQNALRTMPVTKEIRVGSKRAIYKKEVGGRIGDE